jgi:enoyl-CoA hydratase/carnithine racemase
MCEEVPMIDTIEHGEVLELRLARPPVNALSPDLLAAIAERVRGAPDRGARAVILSGREGLFSAGLDVPHLMTLDRRGLGDALRVLFDTMEALALSEVPVAAAITGHSPAGGAVLALCCDRRIMASGDYSIGLNEVSIGIPMPEIVAELACRAVGRRWAEDLCVSGRLLSAREAFEIGCVDQLVEPDSVVEAATAWCEAMLELPRKAMSETRTQMRKDLAELFERQKAGDIRRFSNAWFEPELQEELRRLVERLKGS